MKIPFGKYKNQDIDILCNDISYAKWMLDQEWFKQKYPQLYQEIEILLQEESKDIAKKALSAKENMLLSIDLKREKIENFDEYPLSLNVIKNLTRTKLHPHVTFIVGENGSGKSTLLEALAITQGFNPEGGTTNFNFSTNPTHSNLHEFLRVAKTGKRAKNGFFLRAESFYNVATMIDELGVTSSYGNRSLHKQSHGEAFLSLMSHRFGADGIYILDEPEAALSPNRQMSTLTLIHELVKQGSQFIISTHSPILLSYPSSIIYEIRDEGLVQCDYEDTKTYSISKQFLDSYQKFLDILLED